MTAKIRIGTRGSQLALWQAEHTGDLLCSLQPGLEVEIVPIKSHGDEWHGQRIEDLETVGIFTREIERALLEERVDVAVHSLKDLPTEGVPGLELAAVLPRDDPRDALIATALQGFEADATWAALSALPRGARIGTSSLRRRAQLLRARGDLSVVEVRGNVPTRLAMVEQGDIDGILLSCAGLDRLDLRPPGCVRLDPEVMLPAPAQGTIAVQVRSRDATTRALVSRADHRATRLTTTTERALLHALHGGCRVPLGALATLDGDTLALRARLLTADGSRVLEGEARGAAATSAGIATHVASTLLAQGAALILAGLRSGPA